MSKKNSFDAVYDRCKELYNESGFTAVYDYCNTLSECFYSHCTPCEADTPSHVDKPDCCLVCGSAKPTHLTKEVTLYFTAINVPKDWSDSETYDHMCVAWDKHLEQLNHTP